MAGAARLAGRGGGREGKREREGEIEREKKRERARESERAREMHQGYGVHGGAGGGGVQWLAPTTVAQAPHPGCSF